MSPAFRSSGGQAVTRIYDKDGRLKSVTDWLEHETQFSYDPDSDLSVMKFPSGTSNEDKYAYEATDAMSEVKMLKGTETLASLKYARNKDGAVTSATTAGLPGEEKPAFSYDENTRVTKGAGVAYKYDAADNPTTIGSDTYTYNAADELEKSKLKTTTVNTYTYDEIGERTKTTPASGPATSYGYNQAGELVTVTRPKEGATPAIEDSYAYDGDGLRASQTSASTTTYLAWDVQEKLPLLLNDATNSYIYGAGGLPIEQISASETVLYLHHDQQGSTRMLTTATGTGAGTTSYDAYGNVLGTTGTSTPLGYDGQYANTDTGLVYLRAREYDPATGQFMTVDPRLSESGEPYSYASDNPVNVGDPSGEMIPGQGPRTLSEREKYLYDFFLGKGLKAAQVAGVIGDLLYESAGTLEPTELQEGCEKVEKGCGVGIAQFTNTRYQELVHWARDNGKHWVDLSTQAEFIWYVLNSPEQAGTLAALREARSIAKAAAAFEVGFEKANSEDEEKRLSCHGCR